MIRKWTSEGGGDDKGEETKGEVGGIKVALVLIIRFDDAGLTGIRSWLGYDVPHFPLTNTRLGRLVIFSLSLVLPSSLVI